MSAPPVARRHLPRLAREAYCGYAFVHWVWTIEYRCTGWLTPEFHAQWREGLLHTQARQALVCPVYCLMPDHVHLIWLGCSPTSDQLRATSFLRRLTNPLLAPARWQREAFDHLLREAEREAGAFAAACSYVLENPVRKGICADWRVYPFSGAVVLGFPDLDPRRSDYWTLFWMRYNHLIGYRRSGESAAQRS